MTDDTNLSRRSMLGRIPAAALATTAVISTAALANPGSEIVQLYEEFNRRLAEWKRLTRC